MRRRMSTVSAAPSSSNMSCSVRTSLHTTSTTGGCPAEAAAFSTLRMLPMGTVRNEGGRWRMGGGSAPSGLKHSWYVVPLR